jgi:hypothetical protein
LHLENETVRLFNTTLDTAELGDVALQGIERFGNLRGVGIAGTRDILS